MIVRTHEGERVFAGMENSGLIETREIAGTSEIKEIASRKKEKARQTEDVFKLKKQGLDKKEIAAILGITEERVSHRLDRL